MNKKHWGLILFIILLGGIAAFYFLTQEKGQVELEVSNKESTIHEVEFLNDRPSEKNLQLKKKRKDLRGTSHKKKFTNIEKYIDWFENDSPYQEIKKLKHHLKEIYSCEAKILDLRDEINFYQYEDEDRPSKREEILKKAKEFKLKYGNCTMMAKGALSAINTFFYDNENEKALYLIFKKYKIGEYFEHFQELDRSSYQSKLLILSETLQSEPRLTIEQLKKEQFIRQIFIEGSMPAYFFNLSRLRYLVEAFSILIEYKVINNRFATELEHFENKVNELSVLNINSKNHKDIVYIIEETKSIDSALRSLIIKMNNDSYSAKYKM